LTISLKRSTQKSSAIHKPPADYPIFAPGAVVLSESLLARDTLLMPPRVIHLLAGSLVAWRRPSQLLKQGLRSQGF